MHNDELTDAVSDTYWAEEITLGVGAGVGDIAVSNLHANGVAATASFVEGASMLPEPATCTLGLAALSMLCIRRRRRA